MLDQWLILLSQDNGDVDTLTACMQFLLESPLAEDYHNKHIISTSPSLAAPCRASRVDIGERSFQYRDMRGFTDDVCHGNRRSKITPLQVKYMFFLVFSMCVDLPTSVF